MGQQIPFGNDRQNGKGKTVQKQIPFGNYGQNCKGNGKSRVP